MTVRELIAALEVAPDQDIHVGFQIYRNGEWVTDGVLNAVRNDLDGTWIEVSV